MFYVSTRCDYRKIIEFLFLEVPSRIFKELELKASEVLECVFFAAKT